MERLLKQAMQGEEQGLKATLNAALRRELAAVDKTTEDAVAEPKSARWKLSVAAWMKARTQVGNAWLSQRLHLGTPAAFSRNLTAYRRQLAPSDKLWKTLISISAA